MYMMVGPLLSGGKEIKKITKTFAHQGNRTLVSTVGGYYDTTTPGWDLVLERILFSHHGKVLF
jgi:subtilisin family serine protease